MLDILSFMGFVPKTAGENNGIAKTPLYFAVINNARMPFNFIVSFSIID
jgi:hypothetical protein